MSDSVGTSVGAGTESVESAEELCTGLWYWFTVWSVVGVCDLAGCECAACYVIGLFV